MPNKRNVSIEISERKADAGYLMLNSRSNDDWTDMAKQAFDDYQASHVSKKDQRAFTTLMSIVFRVMEGTFQRREILPFEASSLLKHEPYHGKAVLQEVAMSPGPYSSDGYPAIYGQLLVIQDTDNDVEITVSVDSIIKAIFETGNLSPAESVPEPVE